MYFETSKRRKNEMGAIDALQMYDEMLDIMHSAFRDFEIAVPAPVRVEKEDGWAPRYRDQNPLQAIIQKLALVQSGLRAANILLRSGHVYEQAMLARVVDEANEDIVFLVLALTEDSLTLLHERYLAAFWQEEFSDYSDLLNSAVKREMVPRKKIRAYIARVGGQENNPSKHVTVTTVISKMLSGYVHGASPHLMELYGGQPAYFHTKGMLRTPRIKEHTDDLWNYMYRGFLSHIFAAKAFGSQDHVDMLVEHKKRFEVLAGKNYD